MNPFSPTSDAALVTGSTAGIGRAIAIGLKNAGAEVVFHCETPRPSDLPEDDSYVQSDLFDPAAPDALTAAALAAKPALNLLVCNAGMPSDGDFLEMTVEQWERTMHLNVRATYFVAQSFARALVARKRPGAIVVVSSTNGFQPEEGCTVYDTSKGALINMTRSLAQALAPHGIRVNSIAPGLIRTRLTAPWLDADPAKQLLYEKKTLLGRIGRPEDCAGAATFLLSAAAAYITGQILVVDGGLTVGQIGRL